MGQRTAKASTQGVFDKLKYGRRDACCVRLLVRGAAFERWTLLRLRPGQTGGRSSHQPAEGGDWRSGIGAGKKGDSKSRESRLMGVNGSTFLFSEVAVKARVKVDQTKSDQIKVGNPCISRAADEGPSALPGKCHDAPLKGMAGRRGRSAVENRGRYCRLR